MRHGRQCIGVPVSRSREKCAEQHALCVVGRVRRVRMEVRVARECGITILTLGDRQDLPQAGRERGNRRISLGGRLPQRSRQCRLGLRPRFDATGGKRQHGAITDRRQKRVLLELEILIVLAREQEIQQCGERELLSRLGRGRRPEPVQQGTSKLWLVIERHARTRHAGALRADPSREREVEQRDAVVAIDEDVPRMDVAVHDAVAVQPGVDVEHGDRESE